VEIVEASKRGDDEEVARLLADGADPDARDEIQAWTPMMRALEAGHLELAKRLIEAGADVNAKAETGTTVLMVAAGKGHEEFVRLLLQAGADPGARDMHGKTALDIVDMLARFDPRLNSTRDLLLTAGPS
jgi:ankyrin repeat protein